jgi:hypothetical protein
LHDRGGTEAYYVLAGDISVSGLRTSRLTNGALPSKSGAVAALAEGDIVMALRGTSNPAAVVPSLNRFDRPIFATLDVAVVRAGDMIVATYLAWFLNHPLTQETLSSDRSGSAAPRLPLPALKALAIPLPSIERQIKIAAAAAEAQQERSLIDRIQQSRKRLLDELLRRAADNEPVPRGDSMRTKHPPISGQLA